MTKKAVFDQGFQVVLRAAFIDQNMLAAIDAEAFDLTFISERQQKNNSIQPLMTSRTFLPKGCGQSPVPVWKNAK